MPLNEVETAWLNRFTGGMLRPADPARPARWDAFLRVQARESAAELALKDALIEQAHQRLEPHKDAMRDAFDMEVTMRDGKTLRTRDPQGRQEKALDTQELDAAGKGPDAPALLRAHGMMALIAQERDGLAAIKVDRSQWDDGRQDFAAEQHPLFGDKEIMDELYTPLVRELVLPENFVPARYSATQQMIDGSNEQYIKASRSKPRHVATGGIELTQAALSVGASAAKAVLQTTTNLVDVDGVVTRSDISDVGLSLNQQVEYGAIADGIALVLSAGVGVIGEVNGQSRGEPFKQSTWQIIANNAALGVGTAVTGLTNDIQIGLAVVDGMTSAVGAIGMAGYVAKWFRNGGDFPAHAVLQDAAAAVSSSLKAVSDPTEGSFSKEFVDFSVSFGAALNVWALAGAPKVQAAFRTGKWRDVLPEVMLEIGKEAGIAAASAVADHRVTDAEMAQAGLHTEAQTFERGTVDNHAVTWGVSAFEKTTHAVMKTSRPSKPRHVNELKAAVDALVEFGPQPDRGGGAGVRGRSRRAGR